MTRVIKIFGSEVTLSSNTSNTTLSSVNSARLVRVLNNSNASCLITQMTVSGNTITNVASISIASNQELLIEKGKTVLLISNTASALLACDVAYR